VSHSVSQSRILHNVNVEVEVGGVGCSLGNFQEREKGCVCVGGVEWGYISTLCIIIYKS
jgi:hypothetical protein